MRIAHIASLALAGTITAGCGGGADTQASPDNLPPTVGAIADQSVTANKASEPIAFTVDDEQPGALAFSLSSDNPAVVPDDGLALGGSGRDRAVTITPEVDRLGDAFVTVIVTDGGGLSASRSFLVTIDPEERSMQAFTRSAYEEPADGDPELINAVDWMQDADDDDFADLFPQ